ncbi:uncharacterized protein LOC128679350 [Plodia interpunctella]|uniref:uncharacterized protein LOC128679350 n=1 Tax=Plodia interpunctella TaxID=58824 RepID=UPI00236893BF|nr:uncharacterized protein LOC128679350 [Plodia interpunctella]
MFSDTMDTIDNNQFEVVPSSKSKRKIVTPCSTAYLNPALDLLANEDPMCNTAMEIVPKKRKRTKSDEITTFENTALDVGISKAAVNEFLARELENVRKNIKSYDYSQPTDSKENVPPTTRDVPLAIDNEEPIYANLTNLSKTAETIPNAIVPYRDAQDMDVTVFEPNVSEIEMDSGISVLEQKSLNNATQTEINDFNSNTVNATNIQTNVTNQIFINNTCNLNLSFIDRLALDSPNLSNQSLYLDDDLNESNIMEIKTITIITKKKKIPERKIITNPFLDPNLQLDCPISDQNPFLDENVKELEYNEEMLNNPVKAPAPLPSDLMPRKLFASDTNSTISTMNESNVDQNEYENIDSYRAESPIYENISGELNDTSYNKQSKILGCDVSNFSAVDIMNLNRNKLEPNCSTDSNENKKHFKHSILRASNKLSKKVFKTLKKTFKGEKVEHNATLNPYEVPRKPPKQKPEPKESGIENPCLNLDNSDEIEIEEVDDDDDIEHQYETIKTIRNTRLNMNVTPLKERAVENADFSHNKTNTPGKKVRFDSTLNQEKVITGNSFDCGLQSPGFDAKIDKYHDELENCINERKILQQNM